MTAPADDRPERAACDELRSAILHVCERTDLPTKWHLQALMEAMGSVILVMAEEENGVEADKQADKIILSLFAQLREAVRAHYTPGKPS